MIKFGPCSHNWSKHRAITLVINLDAFAQRYEQPTIRLAVVRNIYLDLIKSDFPEPDFAFAADCDDMNSLPIDLTQVANAVPLLEENAKERPAPLPTFTTATAFFGGSGIHTRTRETYSSRCAMGSSRKDFRMTPRLYWRRSSGKSHFRRYMTHGFQISVLTQRTRAVWDCVSNTGTAKTYDICCITRAPGT